MARKGCLTCIHNENNFFNDKYTTFMYNVKLCFSEALIALFLYATRY